MHPLAPLTLSASLLLASIPAAAATCEGKVSFGEGAGQVVSKVANRKAGTVCFNDIILDTAAEGANYTSHEDFVATVTALAHDWRKRHLINQREFRQLTAAAAASTVGHTMRLRVIALNDFHGNIDGGRLAVSSIAEGYRNVPAGGVAYMAGLVRQLRAGAPNSVVVSAGDLIGASPLNSALFHDEPTIETMNRLGLDFNAVGNHEFDEGKDELLRMKHGGCHPTDANSCQGRLVGTPYPFEGATFDFLAANVRDTATGTTLFPAYGVKTFGQVSVAFIGMTLENTPRLVTPAGVAGLRFDDEADTVNALIGKLRQDGIAAVVVVIHEGGVVSGDINGCDGVSGAIVDIVSRLDDAVDLVVSGHTHQAYNCRLPNRAGRAIPVTSTGFYGRLISRIDLTLDTRSRDVIAAEARNLPVDRENRLGADHPIVPDPAIAAIVANYNALAQPIANRVIGAVTTRIGRQPNAAGESALGDVIADAQLSATRAAGKGAAVVAFTNPGGIRADFGHNGNDDGRVRYGDAFTVQPFGNNLVVKTLTGQQIYDLLEQQWALGQSEHGRILQVSAGFSYAHRFTAGASPLGGRYVCDGSIRIGGVPVDKASPYRVTMNSYLASSGDNFTVFAQGGEQLGGDLDIDALAAWFGSHSPVAPGPQDRIRKVDSCD